MYSKRWEWWWFAFEQITCYVHSVGIEDLVVVDSLFLAFAWCATVFVFYLILFIFPRFLDIIECSICLFNQCECTLSQSHYRSFKLEFCYSNFEREILVWIIAQPKCHNPSMLNECCKRDGNNNKIILYLIKLHIKNIPNEEKVFTVIANVSLYFFLWFCLIDEGMRTHPTEYDFKLEYRSERGKFEIPSTKTKRKQHKFAIDFDTVVQDEWSE